MNYYLSVLSATWLCLPKRGSGKVGAKTQIICGMAGARLGQGWGNVEAQGMVGVRTWFTSWLMTQTVNVHGAIRGLLYSSRDCLSCSSLSTMRSICFWDLQMFLFLCPVSCYGSSSTRLHAVKLKCELLA